MRGERRRTLKARRAFKQNIPVRFDVQARPFGAAFIVAKRRYLRITADVLYPCRTIHCDVANCINVHPINGLRAVFALVPILPAAAGVLGEVKMSKIEYRVRPVTRYVVTKHEKLDNGSGSLRTLGMYDNPDMAQEVAYALCQADHERLGYPPGDMRIIYPQSPTGFSPPRET